MIVIQENRSFDNLFQGYPGADTVPSGKGGGGKTLQLVPISLKRPYDIKHNLTSYLESYNNGRMNGFTEEPTKGDTGKLTHPQYGFVPASESALYFQMANQYVLADRMFASNLDASFVAHQYLIAAQAARAVNLPSGPWGCGFGSHVKTLEDNRTLGPSEASCFDYTTLADELTSRRLSWRYYVPSPPDPATNWSAFHAVKHIWSGSQKNNIIAPETQFLRAVGAGKLATVSWVVPALKNSDHAASLSDTGPDWVATVVNAVGKSSFWNTTAIFVVWDEWGGWYDHVPPPQLDFDGLGFRVPLLVISPYAKQNYVSHVQYESGSILRFVEDTFGLATLAASDARANDPALDCFDFLQTPRAFTPFKTKLSAEDFLREPASAVPPDED